MAPKSTPKKNRSNTPHNRNNKGTKNKTPKTKSRSQTPNHKLVTANKTPTTNQSNQQQQQQQQKPPQTPQLSPETQQAFLEALEDVHTRFILNLPEEELASTDRLFFQIEQAWWFYEDFICDDMDHQNNEQDPNSTNTTSISYAAAAASTTTTTTTKTPKIDYPRYSNLKPFARKIFEISPILNPHMSQFDALWKEFSHYKRKISTFGTILLDESLTQIVLCQDYQTKSWTLPAGKVNQNEKGIDAAVRETYEETGFDINCESGLTKQCQLNHNNDDNDNEDDENEINNYENDNIDDNNTSLRRTWNILSEEDSLVYIENDGSGKRRTCFICHGVPTDFPFEPIVRKEVADIQWHYIDDLPKKTFAILPFMKGLKKWIRRKRKSQNIAKKKQGGSTAGTGNAKKNNNVSTNTATTSRSSSKKKERKSSSNKRQQKQRSGSKGRSSTGNISEHSLVASEDDDLVQSGLGQIGDHNRWSEDDMFRANEELIGRKIEYDGNPQQFATKGFDGIDPHAFRIVGGGFMNSGGNDIAKAPEKSKLQPLFRPNDKEDGDDSGDEGINGKDEDDMELTPFFGNDGSTPWGEQVIASGKKTNANKNALPTRKETRSESFGSTSLNSKSQGSADTVFSQDSIPSASEFEESLFGTNPKTATKDVGDATNNESTKKSSGLAFLTKLRGGNKNIPKDESSERVIPASAPSSNVDENEKTVELDVFMTDREITTKSQREKKGALVKNNHVKKAVDEKYASDKDIQKEDEITILKQKQTKQHTKSQKTTKKEPKRENEDLVYLHNWVKSLPQGQPTKVFGDFRFDVDAIMVAMKAK